MRVALLQYPIAWADKQTNLRLTEQRIATLANKADVALLPEMFSTGFCTDRPDLAEPIDGETITRLQHCADKYQIAIVGSFICRDDGRLFNRGFFLRPQENPVFIDKRHLYAHGGEALFFSAGDNADIVVFKGTKFRLVICYDLRFPVWLRNRTGYDYDVLLVMANWPEVRIQYWDALLPARATENQCYICGVNPVGDDGIGLHYNGHSVAYDTHLRPIASFADNEEGVRIADFDIDNLHHYRQALPLWKDADSFTWDTPVSIN
ncbi:MAG: nitrilase-related carbon-nitrogen hydrolase [Paludibacteraceae bacterium]